MKTLKRKFVRLLSLLSLGLLYNEYLVYYLVLMSCRYPELPDTSSSSSPVMILADTHLLGSRLGHWADKLRREWQMFRAFQTAQTLFSPSHVFFLGDLFDEGKWCPPEEFDYYVTRFQSLFSVAPQTTIHVMAGNHDIGFHYAVTPYLDTRFREAFHTESVQLKILDDDIPVVIINSVAFEGDSCFLCKSTSRLLAKIEKKLKKSGQRPVLMSHYPLYRRSDAHCQESDQAPADHKDDLFREGWDCLTRNASTELLSRLRPSLVLSGHTHHGCNTTHPGEISEISVSSFSWRNKKNPAFYLGYFSKTGYKLSKCFMPNENTVFSSYVFFLSLSLFSIFIK